MEDIEEKSLNNTDSIKNEENNNNKNINSNEVDENIENIPRVVPELKIDDDIVAKSKKDKDPKSPNFIISNENDISRKSSCSDVDTLKKIVPGSVGSKIKQFEIIKENKELPKRKAFRDRVNSNKQYNRQSVALLASNPENKLKFQSYIKQVFNNSGPILPKNQQLLKSAPAIFQPSRLKNTLKSDDEDQKEEDENKKVNKDKDDDKKKVNNEEEEEDNNEDLFTKIRNNNLKLDEMIDSKSNNDLTKVKFDDDKNNDNSRSKSPIVIEEIKEESINEKHIDRGNNENNKKTVETKRVSKILDHRNVKSAIIPQDSPLKYSNTRPESESYEDEALKVEETEIKSDDSFDNVKYNHDDLGLKSAYSDSDEMITPSEVKPLRKIDSFSDTQINKVGLHGSHSGSGSIIFKKQFMAVPTKKNSKASINVIHVKSSREHSRESVKTGSGSGSFHGSDSDENYRRDECFAQASDISPLKIDTRTTSDSNLYTGSSSKDMMVSAKSSKSFYAVPSSAIKKQSIRKSSKLMHVRKKSSLSGMTGSSEESLGSSSMISSPLGQEENLKSSDYNIDILSDYFGESDEEEGGEREENENEYSNSDSVSSQEFNINEDRLRPRSGRHVHLSITTDISHNYPGLNSGELSTNMTPLDQVYNSISQELEERLRKTVRRSILQKVEQDSVMIPINILYEKHYKTQVIYVERKMTIEEVLQQALNSINIYSDYGNYELLQIFGFEDDFDDEEEDKKEEGENKGEEEESNDKENNKDMNRLSTKYQNVLDPSEVVGDVVDATINSSKRKTNNIITFRIRKKTSTVWISIYFEEEKKSCVVLVSKTTTCSEVIEALLFLRNEQYNRGEWYFSRKNIENLDEGKVILEADDTLYTKDENIKYTLKRKSKQMSKLANLLGVSEENDFSSDKKKKDKDKNPKNITELIRKETINNRDSKFTTDNFTEEKAEGFSRILGLSKNEVEHIHKLNKKQNEKSRMKSKKTGSVDQLNLATGGGFSGFIDGERFSSQVRSIFRGKKDKKPRLRNNAITGSLPVLESPKKDIKDDNNADNNNNEPSTPTKYDNDKGSNGDIHAPGKRAKKLGNFFGVKPSQRENTELTNIIRKNYNSKKTIDSSEQYVALRVYFANFNYTTINMSINDTCKTAKKILCERLGIKEADEHLYQIYEFTQKNGYEREVHNYERPFDTMRRWQKDEVFLFKLKNIPPKPKNSQGNIFEKSRKLSIDGLRSLSASEASLNKSNASLNSEQPVKRMAKLAGFFGVVNSKQEEKNNIEKDEEVKGLFSMLHVMSNSKDEATNQIIQFIHSKDYIVDNSVKEGWLYMQVGKSWFNSWCYKDNSGGFNIKNWKSGDIMRIIINDIVSSELSDTKNSGSSSGDTLFKVTVKKDGCGVATQYLFKTKHVIDAIEWVTSLKPSPYRSNEVKKVVIEDDSNFKNNFDAMNIIGKGKYSVVFLCKQLSSQEPFAVKILNSQYKDMWEIEKEILKSISHPFIVDIFQAFEYEDHNYLVMEFINGGDLYYHLTQYGRFSEIRVRFYAAEILLALECLHGRDIIYRDLKLENIMITREGHIKLIDFGHSVPKLLMNVEDVSDTSNIEYIAPEILCGKTYSFASDWWAFGVILYEMLCEKHPFYSNEKEEIVKRILQSPIEFPSYPSRYIKDLITKLLNRDSDKRLGCSSEGGKEIQNHPFFEKIDFTKLYHLEIKPPFKPNVEDAFDIQHFDPQFTDEQINNASDSNLYDEDGYRYNDEEEDENDEEYEDEDNYDMNNYGEDNNYEDNNYNDDNNYDENNYDDGHYERNNDYEGDDYDYGRENDNYSYNRYSQYPEDDNENYSHSYNDQEDIDNRQSYATTTNESKRYSRINHYSTYYEHPDEEENNMNYVDENEEGQHQSNSSFDIQQQRLNNGWGSDDDEEEEEVEEDNSKYLYSMDERNYTKSYIEKQEQRIKNGW